MERVQIKTGLKCFAPTSVCRAPLLCVIEEVRPSTVVLRLPCALKGKTHVEVYIKDIVIQKPQQKSDHEAMNEPPKRIEDNPYRRYLDSVLEKNKSITLQQREEKKQENVDSSHEVPVSDMLEVYLMSLPYEQRCNEIHGLGDDGKEYMHLLKEE